MSNTPEKKIFTNQIREGQSIDDLFMIKDMGRAETRAGKPYLILTLMDRTGETAGRLWDNVEELMPLCVPGNVLLITGQAQAYRGSLQLKVDKVHYIDRDRVDMSLFLQVSPKNIDEMYREIRSLAGSILDPYYKKLLRAFLDDSDFTDTFSRAPAAKTMHHAYLGGLLEHTLAVTQLSEMFASFYKSLDRDLLLTGTLLHDIGKTKELGFDSFPFEYTDSGRLIGHLVLGAEMIRQKINTLPGFPEDQATRLLHLVLSHHGRYEFGSPTLPMVREAFALNFFDDLDAKMNYLGRLEEQANEPGYQWTEFQRTLDRFLFINGRPHSEPEPPAPAQKAPENITEKDTKQRQLFG